MINVPSSQVFKKSNLFFAALLFTPIVLPPHIDASWFGKYKSRTQAYEACKKWMNEKTKFSKAAEYEIYNEYLRTVSKYRNRYCEIEEDTRQFLGIERKGIKDGGQYYMREVNSFEEKIKKNFRY